MKASVNKKIYYISSVELKEKLGIPVDEDIEDIGIHLYSLGHCNNYWYISTIVGE